MIRFSVSQIICQMATDVNRNVSDVVVQKSIFLTMPVLIGYFKVTWYLTIKLFSSISLNLWRHKVTFRRSPNFDCSLWYISLNLSSLKWWSCRTRTNSYQNTIRSKTQQGAFSFCAMINVSCPRLTVRSRVVNMLYLCWIVLQILVTN